MIAVVPLRYCERTRAYLARRTAMVSQARTVRYLKRYLARELYRTLTDDLNDLRRTT
jgi:transposase